MDVFTDGSACGKYLQPLPVKSGRPAL